MFKPRNSIEQKTTCKKKGVKNLNTHAQRKDEEGKGRESNI